LEPGRRDVEALKELETRLKQVTVAFESSGRAFGQFLAGSSEVQGDYVFASPNF